MAEEPQTSPKKVADSQTGSHIADGLLSVIQPVIYETDLRIVGVRQSQNELNKEIERLIAGKAFVRCVRLHLKPKVNNSLLTMKSYSSSQILLTHRLFKHPIQSL